MYSMGGEMLVKCNRKDCLKYIGCWRAFGSTLQHYMNRSEQHLPKELLRRIEEGHEPDGVIWCIWGLKGCTSLVIKCEN